VVIVGAGPAGLMLACELGVRQVPVIVFEERLGPSRHPKANTQSSRSMEIYRRHGLSAKLRGLGLPANRVTDVGYFTKLFGHELFRVSLPSPRAAQAAVRAGDPKWPTPEPQFRITQMEVEPVLLARVLSFPSIEIRFGWKTTHLEQDEQGVRLTAVNCANEDHAEFVARYAIGCDGGKSFMRKALGIRFLGEGGLEMDFLGGHMLATYFRAPTLLSRFPHADTWMHWVMQPAGRAILVLIDVGRHEFLLHIQLKPDQKPEDIDFATRLEAIVGERLPFEVISSAPWRAGIGLVAEHYGKGRCFLVGDAVHLFTPTGGFGLNTGIEDAFNLGWKLAAVCKGCAAPALLESYEIERRPIGLRNTRFALELAQKNGACPVSAALDENGTFGETARAATTAHLSTFARSEFDTPGVQLGARYDGSPIVMPVDVGVIPPDSPTAYVPSTVPGGRLPHAWLADGRALFDALGQDFTFVGFNIAEAQLESWDHAAKSLGIDVKTLDLGHELGVAALIGPECLLIRPDLHIAWRGRADTADPESILRVTAGREHLARESQPKGNVYAS
jgi:2-polyprenyl-6-methoxyphenol hydroxylase-like FAD-dependent oxidoreductase